MLRSLKEKRPHVITLGASAKPFPRPGGLRVDFDPHPKYELEMSEIFGIYGQAIAAAAIVARRFEESRS